MFDRAAPPLQSAQSEGNGARSSGFCFCKSISLALRRGSPLVVLACVVLALAGVRFRLLVGVQTCE